MPKKYHSDSDRNPTAGKIKNKYAGQIEKSLMNKFDDLHLRRVVAGNPNTPEQVLRQLAQDKVSVIRRHVAENPHTPSDILRHLANDSDSDVRLAVAENTNTPNETLTRLAADQNVDVRYGVAENANMPEKILLALTNDENPYVRCRALKTLQTAFPDAPFLLNMIWQTPRQKDKEV